MSGGDVLSKTEGTMLELTLNRPSKLNVLDKHMIEDLITQIEGLKGNDAVRSVVITGAGGKAFCSGVDIKYLSGLGTEKERVAFSELADRLFLMLESIDAPVIAAIDGYCLGGGLELAMACDIRIATDDSIFGLPETKLGIIPGGGGTQRFPYIAGLSKGRELLFTSDAVKASEALALGLLNYVVEKPALQGKVDEIVAKISQNSFNAVKSAKMVINGSFKPTGYALEKDTFLRCFDHPDRKEGMDAFLGKRKPAFK